MGLTIEACMEHAAIREGQHEEVCDAVYQTEGGGECYEDGGAREGWRRRSSTLVVGAPWHFCCEDGGKGEL